MMDFANGQSWQWHMKFTLTLWGLFVLPLFVTLETALLAGWKHGNGTWKVIYTQPVPRWMVITAKQFSGLILLGISHLVLGISVIGNGLLLHQVKPELGLAVPVPWLEMLGYCLLIFLMPSLFEPCGITQMRSLSCGTPPLVRWTGGLVDTVKPHTDADGTGFGFNGSSQKEVLENLLKAVHEALRMYSRDRDAFRELQRRGFNQRFLWSRAAERYVSEVYEPALRM